MQIIRNRNSVEMNAAQPKNFCARERESCSKIISRVEQEDHVIREGLSQMGGMRGHRINKLISQSLSGLTWKELRAIGGSNDEKMSVNIQGCVVLLRS